MSASEVLDVGEEQTPPDTDPVSVAVSVVEDSVDQLAPVLNLPVIAPDNEFRALAMQAKMLSGSSLVPKDLRGKPHDVLLVLMTGRDLGIAPTAALRKCYVVDGQVTIAPALKLALVKIKGMGCVRPAPDNDRTHATAIAYDAKGQEIARQTVTWDDVKDVTIDYAGKKRMVDKDNWRNYPARMLWWRSAGWLVDDIWPEVAFGLYTPDEIGAMTDEEGRVVDVREVVVVDGYEKHKPAEAEKIADAVAEALTARASALPDGAKDELKAMFREREIRGSIFSQLASKEKVIDPMIALFEKRAANGEWGDWSPAPAETVSEPEVEPVAPPENVDGHTGVIADPEPPPEIDGTWDAADLLTLPAEHLALAPEGVLRAACTELGTEPAENATHADLVTLFNDLAEAGF